MMRNENEMSLTPLAEVFAGDDLLFGGAGIRKVDAGGTANDATFEMRSMG